MTNQFLKFLLVGALNTAFGYAVFALILIFNIHYTVAAALSTALGILFNYRTFGSLVFNSNRNGRFWRFILVYIFIYLLNVGGISLLIDYGTNAFWGGAVMILPCALTSFFLQKMVVFNHD